MSDEVSRGEFLASFLGAAVPAAVVFSWYYIEILPMFRKLPAVITPEQAAKFTAYNSLLIFTAFTLYFTFNMMSVGSGISKWIHWRYFQEDDSDE